MPATTLLDIPPEEQAQMRAVLRRMRYGYLLALHVLLLCADGRNPTEIAAFLFCSRSSVYRIVRAYRTGSLGVRVDQDGRLSVAVRATVLMPWLTRSWALYSKWLHGPMAGAASAGVVPHLRRRSRLNTGSRCRRKRCAAGSMGWMWKRAKLVGLVRG